MNNMNFSYFTLIRCRQHNEPEINPRLPVKFQPNFPVELVEEILSRVHPKELISYKLANRGFNRLISGKAFLMQNLIKMEYLNRSVYVFQKEPSYSPICYHISGVDRPDSGRVIDMNEVEIKLLCSVDGMILYCDTTEDFFLFNPLLKKREILNYCEHVYPPNSTSSEVFYGIGYVYDDNDYKIVRVSTFNDPELSTRAMVYSRNSGVWHRANNLRTRIAITQAGVNVHGHLHWRTANVSNEYMITVFNLRTETYSAMELPTVDPGDGAHQLYGLDSETLALCCPFQSHGSTYSIWILKKYGDPSSWYNIEVNFSHVDHHMGVYSLRPLSLIYPERKKMLLRIDPTGEFLIYDFEEKVFNEVGYEEVGQGYMCAYRFVPTLRSPHPTV